MSTDNPAVKHKRIGDVLLDRGFINADQLHIALQQQKLTGKALGEALLDLGFITEEAMLDAVSESVGHESIELSSIIADASALAFVPKHIALKHALFPVSYDSERGELIVAAANPDDIVARDTVVSLLVRASQGMAKRIKPLWRIASSSEVLATIDRFYDRELSIDGILVELESGQLDLLALSQAGVAYSHPIVRLMDALFADAVSHGASDIHFEPEESFLRIRYRIDGVLRPIRSLAKPNWTAMLVRLKVMSNMNIAETRAPQDGRISLSLFGRQIDFRAAAQPTIHGENFVLRVLDRKRSVVALDGLGLTEFQLNLLKLMLERPEGILLVTGPTGSGKTTTLYSVLNHLNTVGVNIMTLEDPVEYPLAMIRQTSVAEAVKLDFAEGIRSLMRQDPDIIFVGEIRDKDTAEMAVRSAMTGHQVFSTLHTNSAIRSIPRLVDLGVHAEILSGNIIGIVAQRLVRRLCPHCKAAYTPDEAEKAILGVHYNEASTIYRANGCPACEGEGYKGRLAIIEILRFDRGLDELVARGALIQEMNDYAVSKGFVEIAEDGIRRVREGSTSLDEIRRVVDLTDRISV
ncbi:MAG: GspE/PulE family protein [Sideroxydans sp.]|nr:GspE/PulE family protein [Sideroxydans sp.]